MPKRKLLILFVVLIVFSACSEGGVFEVDTFSEQDMCIKHIDSGDTVCYGDKRNDVESVLGMGAEDEWFGHDYDFGVKIQYRDDRVAGIQLTEESENRFTTFRGASIGMTKDEIRGLYGEKYALEQAERNLDYFYDSTNERFIGEISIRQERSREELENIYGINFATNYDGEVNSIMLLDYRLAMFME